MARVPLQTAPQEQLEAGSEVQFSGGPGVEPMKDVVSDDITRFGTAQQNVGKALLKLGAELDDAEATELSNNLHDELNALETKYENLKGADAVKTLEVNGEKVSVFKQYQNKAKEIYESYEKKASNGTVRDILRSKGSVYKNAFINNITKHSLREQRTYRNNEAVKEIQIAQTDAKTHFESWNDPNGLFRQNYAIGLAKIQELAQLKGWNIDPDAIDPTDPKGERKLGISHQYLAKIEEYNMDVLQGVYGNLVAKKDFRGAKDFLRSLDPKGKSKDINALVKTVTAAQIEYGNGKCVDSIISNNGNQNDGTYSSQSDALLCLSSNQAHDNNNGGSVIDGENSNEVNTTDKTQSENLESLDQRRSTSKFYQPDSSVRLIPQHQTTHLFAIQKLGVEKADSLYTKAKSSIEIDKERFKVDPEYATEINKQIIGNYNKLIIEASVEKYGNKEIPKLINQINELESAPTFYTPSTKGGPPSQSDIINMNKDLVKNKKLIELREELRKLEENDPKYVEKIANDLNIITNGIDYNFSSTESTVKVDEVTGLQPLEVLKAKLKATITDPKELETATKDLEIKYNKLKTEREGLYKGALEKAQEIAFAEPGGWKKLEANNIDINDFTKEDQEILRNGPPEESNVDTEVELINNPAEVRDNLNVHRPKLSATQYLKLKQYSESLNNENNYVEATGNTTLLNATLTKNNMGHLWTSKKEKDKKQYVLINNAWIAEINARQIAKGNVKLTYGEKLAALNFVLMDKVNVDNWLRDEKNVNYHLVDQDRLQDVFVDIQYKGKKETVFISKIDPDVLTLIKASLRSAGKTVSQENIADYYLRKGRPKNEAEARAYKEEEE